MTGDRVRRMSRIAWVAACVLAGCASAGSGVTPDADTGGPRDGSVDARPIDAPVTAMTCAGPDTCQSAMMLGSVSGDSGNQKLTTSGFRSAWIRVRVSEDVDGVSGLSLRVAAKLTSPAN